MAELACDELETIYIVHQYGLVKRRYTLVYYKIHKNDNMCLYLLIPRKY